jgi:hypothetical protein
MIEVFTKSFINCEYKKYREHILIDRERSLLPTAMVHVEKLKSLREIDQEIRGMSFRIPYESRQITIYFGMGLDGLERYQQACTAYKILMVDIEFLKKKKQLITEKEPKLNNRQFVRACPAEGCRGFLSMQWKCGMCDVWACPDCHEVIGKDKKAEHTCKLENIESANLIAKDSRPCPSCASMIFKIEGCDQMYCVQCHTPFSWNTGKIENGRIHNPHYYELMRKNNGGVIPREVGDNECGGAPTPPLVIRHLQKLYYNSKNETPDSISKSLQLWAHMDNIIQDDVVQEQALRDNTYLRVKFIMNEIDEDRFKQLLQQREKKYEKIQDTRFTLTMFNTALGDMLQRVVKSKAEAEVDDIIAEMNGLVDYTNGCLDRIGDRYNCMVGKFTDWIYTPKVRRLKK